MKQAIYIGVTLFLAVILFLLYIFKRQIINDYSILICLLGLIGGPYFNQFVNNYVEKRNINK